MKVAIWPLVIRRNPVEARASVLTFVSSIKVRLRGDVYTLLK